MTTSMSRYNEMVTYCEMIDIDQYHHLPHRGRSTN